jgi:uncharacterized membrane protein YwaF
MYDFLKWTAVKMPLVKPYGTFHLTFFIVGLLISIFLAIKLKKLPKKKLNWVLFALGLFLFVTEIYKQLFYTYYIGHGDYQEWIFPFQLCSIPMYFCLMIPFIKNKKVYNAIMAFLVSYNLLGGFTAFLEPSGLIHEYYTLTYHAFIWHMLVTFIGLLVGFNQNIKYTKIEFKNNIYLFLCLCLMAFIINLIIGHGINMFFIGPENSPIIVFKNISAKFGWFVNDLIYIPLMTIGSYLMYYPFTRIKK